MGIAEHPAVEIGLIYQPARGIIGVPPSQALRVGDGRQPQFGVVGEFEPCAVRPNLGGPQVEVCDLVPCGLAQDVDVRNEVPLRVVVPAFAPPPGRVRDASLPSGVQPNRDSPPMGFSTVETRWNAHGGIAWYGPSRP
jgi:hypothetical protein